MKSHGWEIQFQRAALSAAEDDTGEGGAGLTRCTNDFFNSNKDIPVRTKAVNECWRKHWHGFLGSCLHLLDLFYISSMFSAFNVTLLHLLPFISCPSVKHLHILREEWKVKTFPPCLYHSILHFIVLQHKTLKLSCHWGGERGGGARAGEREGD